MHKNRKYPVELLNKAKKEYEKGKKSLEDVCKKYQIQSISSLRYHLSPEIRERMKESTKKWASKHHGTKKENNNTKEEAGD